MKKKLVAIFVCFFISFSFVGTISSISLKKKSIDYNSINLDFTHTILGEFFTINACVPSKYSHQALKELYAEGYHPFYYITYIYDKNNNSKMRRNELNVVGSPTTKFDGGYETVVGGESVEGEKTRFNDSILDCGARTVNDIDLNLNVEWLGAVNPSPPDGETFSGIEACITANVTEMRIDVEVTNNEASEYDGHLHIQVTENESEWWDDKFGNPYSHEFKDYAYNDDVTISPGETFSETIYWDGCDYNDADGPPRYFDHIIQDNILVIASVFDKDNNKYVDDVVGVHTGGYHAGVFYDPKTCDIYFGDTYPPPKVLSNGTRIIYCPPGDLNWSTTYYWKVDVINNLGEIISGEVWSFTTRGNSPPNEPTPVFPPDGAENISICFSAIEWNCSDPDGDDLTYDIYFGDSNPPPMIESNWSGNTYDPQPYGQNFEFNKNYYWKIVAWDPYGESATGGIWEFKTEKNVPPNPACKPRPPDGADRVPVNVILYWNGSDPNLCDNLKYDVYFGLYDPPIIKEQNQSETTYDPNGPNGDLKLNETYYWKIVTWDRSGERSESPVWTFSTDPIYMPPPPDIDGPNRGKPGILYEFQFMSANSDNESIKYKIKWGDGNINETDYHEPNKPIKLSHKWHSKGIYIIQARVITSYGSESRWAEHEIIIPRSKEIKNLHNLLSLFLYRYPMLESLFHLMRIL
ncbi:hypothetical protein AYK20_05185 [Thermoplasmatales archaeon SG8-52-1]|nr:MAG: hypothetical protein AYK20_05185 [Thermoplasmatales archaeon SG8-52-1]